MSKRLASSRGGRCFRRRHRPASRAGEIAARERVRAGSSDTPRRAARRVARAPAAPAPRRWRRRSREVLRHAPRGAPRGPRRRPPCGASMKSSAIVASGAITRSTDEWLMSRSCQSAMFSSAATRVAAHQARQPADVLGEDRVALVRHRRRALLALAERLLRLAHLGALQVADLGRDALERPGQDGERREEHRVAVARDDLGGDRLRRRARAARGPSASTVGSMVRERPDGARELAEARSRRAPRPAASGRAAARRTSSRT